MVDAPGIPGYRIEKKLGEGKNPRL